MQFPHYNSELAKQLRPAWLGLAYSSQRRRAARHHSRFAHVHFWRQCSRIGCTA